MVIFLLLLIYSRSKRLRVKYAFSFLTLCLGGYLFLYLAPKWLAPSLYLLNLLLPTSLSLLVSSVFGDRLHRRFHALAAVLILAAGTVYLLSDPPLEGARTVAFLANASLSFFAFRNGWINFKDDLNEKRKRQRLMIAYALLSYVVLAALLSLILPWDSNFRDLLRLGEGVVLLFAMLAINLLSISAAFSGSLFGMDPPQKPHELSVAVPPPQAGPPPSQSADELKILQFMDQQKPYLEARLSLDTLAAAVGVPQHRLRNVLHNRLEYENFNDFINKYRVEQAAKLLSSPDGAVEKVFAIALQSGFSSLAPFNRAFKKHFGVTPSEYRSRVQTGTGPAENQ